MLRSRHRLYAIPTPPPGWLSVMPHPHGRNRLDGELAALRQAGVDVLVCLLPEAERARLGLADEPVAAARAGLEFRVLPIPDFGVPDRATAEPMLRLLHDRLLAGAHVAVHCRGGVGRSSLVAAACLVRLGVAQDRVWRVIGQARGARVPETRGQRQWLTANAGWLRPD